MKKNILLHPSTKSIELAEKYATQYCKLKGLKVGGKQWLSAKESFLYDDIFESKLPANSSYKKEMEEKFRSNPGISKLRKESEKYLKNPKIANSVMESFPEFFGSADSIILKSVGGDKGQNKVKALRGICTQLTHLYLETMLKMNVKAKYTRGDDGKVEKYSASAFEFEKGAEGEDREEVVRYRYYRIIIFTAIMQSLAPIFKISESDLSNYLESIGWKEKGLAYFTSKAGRAEVIQNLNAKLQKVYQSKSLIESVKTLGT